MGDTMNALLAKATSPPLESTMDFETKEIDLIESEVLVRRYLDQNMLRGVSV